MMKSSVKISSAPATKLTSSNSQHIGIKSHFIKIKIWLKEKFKRKKNLSQRLGMVEDTIVELIKHGLQQDGFDRESRVKMIEAVKSHLKDEAKSLIDKEKKNRIAAIKTAEKRAVEKATFEVNAVLVKLEGGLTVVADMSERLAVREANLDGLISTFRKKITEVEGYLKKLKMIEGLADSAKDAYHMYLNDLRKEISEANESHAIPRRMASIETRITQLEIGHNGSGKKTSRATGAHQD